MLCRWNHFLLFLELFTEFNIGKQKEVTLTLENETKMTTFASVKTMGGYKDVGDKRKGKGTATRVTFKYCKVDGHGIENCFQIIGYLD